MPPTSGPSMPLAMERRWAFCGTFLISFALLSFEVSTVRTINFTVGPSYIYFAIALAMLGLSAAGSVLSLVDLKSVTLTRERVLFWACLAIAALLIAAHFLAASVKADINAAIAQAGRADGLVGIVGVLIGKSIRAALLIGMALSLPYFLFGALLAYLFATTEAPIYGRLYASDLIGAAMGCVGAILVMELANYALSVTAPAIGAALAAAAFAVPSSRRLAGCGVVATAVLCVLPRMGWYSASIEPPADPNYLDRDYSYKAQLKEVWRGWNSFTRVGAIEAKNGDRAHAIMSLGNGEGLAWLHPFVPDRAKPLRHRAALPAMLLDPPEDALVLFAGAGGDVMSLYENGRGKTRVTGVELNPRLVEGALGLTKYRMADFLARPKVSLEVSEGRVFLDRDRRRYDTILLSWSGATASYYAGTLGGTTQFLYTYEGLSAVLDHLKPEGHAVILTVNKVNALAALRRYLDERGIDGAARTSIVLYDPRHFAHRWDGAWDHNPLLIKPDGWTAEEVARIKANAAKDGWRVAYAPGLPVNEDYRVYARILKAPDIDAEIAALRSETGLRFAIFTDDRPFYLDLFANELYFSAKFWGDVLRGAVTRGHQMAHAIRVILVLIVCMAAVFLILAPLLASRGPKLGVRSLHHLTYFFCLGTGFMFLEIGLMQKSSLLFGNPGVTIAIVLASIILFSGIGSLMSNWSFQGGLSFPVIAGAVFAYALGLHFGLDASLKAMLVWPLLAKALMLAAIIAPGALLMGHLFPQGLAVAGREDLALIPWAWGINGAMGTIAAGVAPLVAQAWGFSTLFLIAAGLYGLIVALPPYRRRTVAPVAMRTAAVQPSGIKG